MKHVCCSPRFIIVVCRQLPQQPKQKDNSLSKHTSVAKVVYLISAES